MIEDVRFMGRKIGENERHKIAECFGEKIDDLKLCHAILAMAAQPDFALERGAFARALKHGYCSDLEGGRAAKALIRKMRKKLGYKDSIAEKVKKILKPKKKRR